MTTIVKQAEDAAARLYNAATRVADAKRKADFETDYAADAAKDAGYSGVWTAYNLANTIAKDAASFRYMAFEAALAYEQVARNYAGVMYSKDVCLTASDAKAATDAAAAAYIASETAAAQARMTLRLVTR